MTDDQRDNIRKFMEYIGADQRWHRMLSCRAGHSPGVLVGVLCTVDDCKRKLDEISGWKCDRDHATGMVLDRMNEIAKEQALSERSRCYIEQKDPA